MDDQQALEKRQKAIDARTNLEGMMKETSLITNGNSPFMGNAHPQSLLYSNSVTETTDYTHGGKHLEQLYTGKRRAKISLDVIREMQPL